MAKHNKKPKASVTAYKCGGTHKYGHGGAVNFSKAMKKCRKKR